MRLAHASATVLAVALLVPAGPAALGQDADRVVAGGGITAEGWQGKIDAAASGRGLTINASKFMKMGNDFHAQIGPAAIYWNPVNTATGAFSVSGTFKEGKMDAGHPHPAGVFIGGANLEGTDQRFVYCTAYGTGEFLVRQFNGPGRPTTPVAKQAHEAVHKAGADGSVSNDVGWNVTADRADCVINGTVVKSFAKSELIPTDGIVGLRFSHNMDVTVSGFALKKN
jgi:hypothetical protein